MKFAHCTIMAHNDKYVDVKWLSNDFIESIPRQADLFQDLEDFQGGTSRKKRKSVDSAPIYKALEAVLEMASQPRDVHSRKRRGRKPMRVEGEGAVSIEVEDALLYLDKVSVHKLQFNFICIRNTTHFKR
jgi:hypothetical protein